MSWNPDARRTSALLRIAGKGWGEDERDAAPASASAPIRPSGTFPREWGKERSRTGDAC